MRPPRPAPGVPSRHIDRSGLHGTPPSRRARTETTRTPAAGRRAPAERRVRVAAPPTLRQAGGIHPSILPLGPWLGQVPIGTASGSPFTSPGNRRVTGIGELINRVDVS